MTINFQILHLDTDSDRTLEIWLSGAAAPVQIRPGESMCFTVWAGGKVAVTEGPTVEEVEHGWAGKRAPRQERINPEDDGA